MEYVLIIILNLGHGGKQNEPPTLPIEPRIIMQDFYSKKACEHAKEEIAKSVQGGAIAKAICVEKGK